MSTPSHQWTNSFHGAYRHMTGSHGISTAGNSWPRVLKWCKVFLYGLHCSLWSTPMILKQFAIPFANTIIPKSYSWVDKVLWRDPHLQKFKHFRVGRVSDFCFQNFQKRSTGYNHIGVNKPIACNKYPLHKTVDQTIVPIKGPKFCFIYTSFLFLDQTQWLVSKTPLSF